MNLSFAKLLPALAAARQVIAVKLQGHGRTADTDRELTIEHLAGDAIALLDHLHVEHAAEMFELIPDSQLAVLPGTTHLGVIQRADIVIPIIESFLKS